LFLIFFFVVIIVLIHDTIDNQIHQEHVLLQDYYKDKVHQAKSDQEIYRDRAQVSSSSYDMQRILLLIGDDVTLCMMM